MYQAHGKKVDLKKIRQNLKLHCSQNKQQLECVLSLYARQLQGYSEQHTQALELLQKHHKRRLAVINHSLSQQSERQQRPILLCNCPTETWLKASIPTFDGEINEDQLTSLSQPSQQLQYLAYVAAECLLELQWDQALTALARIVSLDAQDASPYFYLAMVVVALAAELNAGRVLSLDVGGSLWLEGELKMKVYQQIRALGLQNPRLAFLHSVLADLHQSYRLAVQSLRGAEWERLIQACDGMQGADGQFPLSYLLRATALNSRPCSAAERRQAKQCLGKFDRKLGKSTNIRIISKAFQQFSLTSDRIKASQYRQRLETQLNAWDVPVRPNYADWLKTILTRQAEQLSAIRWQISSILVKPEQQARQGPQFSKQKKELEDEKIDKEPAVDAVDAVDVIDVIDVIDAVDAVGAADAVDAVDAVEAVDGAIGRKQQQQGEEKNPARLKGRLQLEGELAQAVGLMTFFWLDESGRELKSVQGTGFLISSQVVVTARHNFYHRSRPGVRCTGCTIQLTTAQRPEQTLTYQGRPSSEWFESEVDVGAVWLDRPVLHFRGNIRFACRNDALKLREHDQLLLMGYSLEYRRSGQPDSLKRLTPAFIHLKPPYCEYAANTVSGLSGSPVFIEADGPFYYVAAVHVSRKLPTEICRGILLNDRLTSQVAAWAQGKFSQQFSLSLAFDRLASALQTALGAFREQLLTVNRDANFAELLEVWREKILRERENREVLREVTCKLLQVAQPEDIEKFYGRLYLHDKLENARIELQRLRFVCPAPQQLRLEVDSKAKEEVDFKAIGFKAEEAIDFKAEEEVDFKAEEEEDECSNTSEMDIKAATGDSAVFSENEEGSEVASQIAVESNQMKEWPEMEGCQQCKITLEPERGTGRDVQFTQFLQYRYNSARAVVKYLSDLPENSLRFVARHRLLSSGKREFRFLVEEGWRDGGRRDEDGGWRDGDGGWLECMGRGLLLVLLRDMCGMVMELECHRIYLANLQKRNIILFSTHQNTPDYRAHPRLALPPLAALRFKLVDFEYALCLANEETRLPVTKMVVAGERLVRNGDVRMSQEPLSCFLSGRGGRKGNSELEVRFKEQYKTSLSNHISYLGAYEGKRLLQPEESSKLQSLCQKREYGKMVEYLSTAIQREST